MTTLFDPVQMGALKLRNRFVMAPLTRCRAVGGRVPNDLMVEYYRQRAGAGLIISEATAVDPMGVGYPDTPGIWNEAMVQGWRKVTDAVHAEGGLIVLQLWHVGRISDPVYLDGKLPVAPSAIAAPGHVSQIRPYKNFVTPRALELSELPGIVAAYRLGAENAQRAGFDGVEMHGANGYLLDQFLQDGTNKRTDEYGGPVENRARLMLEATDAAISVWGADRVGMHLAPKGEAHGMADSDTAATFGYVGRELGRRGIAFICARETQAEPYYSRTIRREFGGAFIANEGLDGATAARVVETGVADAVAFGKAFIANPDLPRRLREGAPLNEQRPETFYGGAAEGYVDYPALDSVGAA